ncbi:UDP-N-acetylmuramate dehydrogenase [Pseudomonas helleri]|uniref:UDP-N-acetylmuramate dehydrogenase n=1 Tax=Pseudomonas helleri TaxID=1608996 RepID=UPI00382AEED4
MNTDITEDQIASTESFLYDNNIWFKKDYNIKYDTFFKTGGVVKIFITPRCAKELSKAVTYLYNSKIKYKIIGFTSNIILFDEIEYSILISTCNIKNISIGEGYVDVGCGYSLQDFVRVAIINGVVGYEGLEGIPGSIGGGVFMNAGAYGYEIATNIISIDYIEEDGKQKTISKEQCGFAYRKSFFKSSNNIITSVRFKFNRSVNNKNIVERVERYHIARHSYQEFSYPNLGSMFSVNKDFYRELIKNESKSFLMLYYILKILTKNPISKFINRKSPNSSALIWLISKKMKQSNYSPSKKGMNILINSGQLSTKESFDYIVEIKNKLGDEFHIENESILGPVYKIRPEFVPLFQSIKQNLMTTEKELSK